MQTCPRCGESRPVEDFNPSSRGKKGAWCKPCMAAYQRLRKRGIPPPPSPRPTETNQCVQCGVVYAPKARRPSVFCSPTCKDNARNAATKSALASAKPDRQCVHCGKDMPKTMRADAKFCSHQCNSAAHAVTRKMAKRAGRAKTPGDPLLERNAIAARDKFRCQLCGGKVDMGRKHPDPLCASIDHLVPLAAGGTNDLANLQLAHLQCNLRKRADCLTPEQLRLVG